MAVWIDEDGVLVQPAHVAQVAPAPPGADAPLPDNLPDTCATLLETARRIPRTRRAVPARRCGTGPANGAASRYALSPDQVVARSKPRPPEHAEAAACFELGQHLLAGRRP